MKRSSFLFGIARVPVDALMLTAAALAAYALRVSEPVAHIRPVEFDLSLLEFLPIASAVAGILVCVLAASGLYGMRVRPTLLRELSQVTIGLSVGMMLLILVLFLSLTWFDSRFIILVGWLFAIIFVGAGRIGVRALRTVLLHRYGVGRTNVLLIGSGEELEKAKRYLSAEGGKSITLVGTFPLPHRELIERVADSRSLDRILMVNSYEQRAEVVRIISLCQERGIEFSYVPDMFGSLVADMDLRVARGVAVVSLRPTPLEGWWWVSKRIVDMFGSVAILVALSPLFAAIAFAIKWESKGPVFVSLQRVSRGRTFRMLKFRSMIDGAHAMKGELALLNERSDGPLFKMKNDPRVTRVGAFLRRYRLDEFPQIINVLRGEMSLVGPRPHEPEEVARYEEEHKTVFAVAAGVTGFAQVNGAQDLPFEEEVKLDRYYIEHWSLRRDIAILLKTLWIFLFSPNGV